MTRFDPKWGSLFTIDEFQADVRAGGFVRSDGDGCWATATEYDICSNVWSDPKPSGATHVAWFNA